MKIIVDELIAMKVVVFAGKCKDKHDQEETLRFFQGLKESLSFKINGHEVKVLREINDKGRKVICIDCPAGQCAEKIISLINSKCNPLNQGR